MKEWRWEIWEWEQFGWFWFHSFTALSANKDIYSDVRMRMIKATRRAERDKAQVWLIR
jgi:hypothetical protein